MDAEGGGQRSRKMKPAISDVDIRLLRVFQAVVENGGFAASEGALGKSKSAISLDVSGLENRLGLRLCRRGRGGFSLTEEGEAVYSAALSLFEQIDRFSDLIAGVAGELTGQVTLMVIDNIGSIAADAMIQAIGAYRRQHPKVTLKLISGAAGAVERAVLSGAAQVGISLLSRPSPALDTHPLFTEELLLHCGSAHPLFHVPDDEIDRERLLQHPLILPSVADDDAFGGFLEGFESGAEASNLDCLVLAILAGVDLGFLPPHYARSWVESGQLRAIRADVFSTWNTFHLMTARGVTATLATQALVQVCLRAFQTHQVSSVERPQKRS